jgi:hypothetical protein
VTAAVLMNRLLLPAIALLALAGAPGLRAAPVTRREVLAAVAVLEKDVTAPGAAAAAETVTRFGRESDDVLLIIGPETLPWVRNDVPAAEVRPRSLLLAAYFAGDIKSQLLRGAARDDPYHGWLAAIRAYGQLRRAHPELEIPEIDELIRQERAGTLRAAAAAILQEQENEHGREPRHMV